MKLSEIRKNNGISIEDVAKQLDISLTEYKKIENGDLDPSVMQLVKLADMLDTSVDNILGHTSKLKLSSGELVWHNIRKSLPKDKLETITQMINGVSRLELSESDIKNICDTSSDCISPCDISTQLTKLFAVKDDKDLTFDDYLIMHKIAAGEKILIDNFDSTSVTTKYSFTYNGQLYGSSTVSHILSRLFHTHHFLNFDLTIDTQKEKIDNIYPKLNRKAKALLKEKELEYKELI